MYNSNYRLRDEKVDERSLLREHKLRDCSQNGSSHGHSPILNLSKSGIDHSLGEQSEHSEERSSPAPSPLPDDDDDNISERNETDIDERDDKDDSKF